jgi:hypothetical protein
MFGFVRIFRSGIDGDALPRDGADRVRVVADDVADANLKDKQFDFVLSDENTINLNKIIVNKNKNSR